jgi:hypothetical protein
MKQLNYKIPKEMKFESAFAEIWSAIRCEMKKHKIKYNENFKAEYYFNEKDKLWHFNLISDECQS